MSMRSQRATCSLPPRLSLFGGEGAKCPRTILEFLLRFPSALLKLFIYMFLFERKLGNSNLTSGVLIFFFLHLTKIWTKKKPTNQINGSFSCIQGEGDQRILANHKVPDEVDVIALFFFSSNLNQERSEK